MTTFWVDPGLLRAHSADLEDSGRRLEALIAVAPATDWASQHAAQVFTKQSQAGTVPANHAVLHCEYAGQVLGNCAVALQQADETGAISLPGAVDGGMMPPPPPPCIAAGVSMPAPVPMNGHHWARAFERGDSRPMYDFGHAADAHADRLEEWEQQLHPLAAAFSSDWSSGHLAAEGILKLRSWLAHDAEPHFRGLAASAHTIAEAFDNAKYTSPSSHELLHAYANWWCLQAANTDGSLTGHVIAAARQYADTHLQALEAGNYYAGQVSQTIAALRPPPQHAPPIAHRAVPLHEVHTKAELGSTTQGVVNVSVNGGPAVPVVVDTGSNGLVLPITDIGLQHLGLPTGFHQVTYGTSELSQTQGIVTFNAPIDFGNGIVTAPTQVNVPLFTVVHENLHGVPLTIPYPNVPPFTNIFSHGGSEGILGIGPSAVGPNHTPLLSALPSPLNQGVLINAPGGYLEFGPNPLPGSLSVAGAPFTTLDVQINNGPLHHVPAAIDSGGQFGAFPASVVGNNTVPINVPSLGSFGETVPVGTHVSVYTPDGHTLLYQYTTAAGQNPEVVPENLFNTGNVPFLQQPVYIKDGP